MLEEKREQLQLDFTKKEEVVIDIDAKVEEYHVLNANKKELETRLKILNTELKELIEDSYTTKDGKLIAKITPRTKVSYDEVKLLEYLKKENLTGYIKEVPNTKLIKTAENTNQIILNEDLKEVKIELSLSVKTLTE